MFRPNGSNGPNRLVTALPAGRLVAQISDAAPAGWHPEPQRQTLEANGGATAQHTRLNAVVFR